MANDMSDHSPSVDDVKRQHECLKKCGQDFLAIEQIWVQYYNDKKISAEQALAEFKKANGVHRECCDK
jgi:hypothetical protein